MLIWLVYLADFLSSTHVGDYCINQDAMLDWKKSILIVPSARIYVHNTSYSAY